MGSGQHVDVTHPSAARVYDCLLGGKDNFGPDRDLADRLNAQSGGRAGELARANRAFVLRAVTWTASMLGIGQFLDLGCGLPSEPSVHEAARSGCAGARVVYADRDPMVLSHVTALQSGDGLGAVLADVSDAAGTLEAVGGLGLIDLGRPACAVFGGTLSSMAPDVAREAVAGFTGAMAPGSAVIISCASYADPGLAALMTEAGSAVGGWRNHGLADVASFFSGLRVVRGRVADVRCWPLLPDRDADAAVLGGIGVRN